MWDLLQGIQEQVIRYSTPIGQLWYLCVFVFRLIVVVTIGGAVYGDELSEFACSTREPGCEKMCFNVFNQMSHIRFWAFQLLAITTPTVLFHFYSSAVTGRIQRYKVENEENEKLLNGSDNQTVFSSPPQTEKEHDKAVKMIKKIEKREKEVKKAKFKKVYTKGAVTEIPYTATIHIAYFVSVILRLTLEGVFIYLGYQLFKFLDQTRTAEQNESLFGLDFVLFAVPALFKCQGDNPNVQIACSQAIQIGGVVPCWVSRPAEKTILIRYMNSLSAICFLLSATEIVYLLGYELLYKRYMKKKSRYGRHYGPPIYGMSTMRSKSNHYVTPDGYGFANTPYVTSRAGVPPRVIQTDEMSMMYGAAAMPRVPSMRTINTIEPAYKPNIPVPHDQNPNGIQQPLPLGFEAGYVHMPNGDGMHTIANADINHHPNIVD